MPDQPTTEAQVAPQVSPSAELPMAFTPDALGATIGESLATAGEVATKLRHDAVQRANETAILDGDNRTNEFLNQRLYDAKTGILHQQLGQDAPAAVDQVLTDFDKHTATVSAGMANDQQRLSYQRMAVNRRFDLERQLGTYEHGEVTRAQQETRQSAVAARTTTAVQSAAADPDRALQAMLEGKAIIADDGRGKHQSPDVIRERQTEFASATHLGVLENLTATGNDRFAQTWYDAHKDELTGKDATMAARLVEAGSLAGEATRIADRIVRTPLGEVDDRASVLDKIENDQRLAADPKLRAEVETRAMHALDLHHEAQRESDAATTDEAWKILSDPGNTQGPYDPRYVALKATLPPERQQQLANAERREIPEFSQDYYDLRRTVGTPAFEHVDLSTFRGRVPDRQLAELAVLQNEQVTKGSRAPKVVEEVTQQRVVDHALNGLGLDSASDRNGDAAYAFRRAFDFASDAARAAKGGKPLSEDEQDAIAQKIQGDYVVQNVARGWYNPARWFGSPTTTDTQKLYLQPRDVVGREGARVVRDEPIPGTTGTTGDFLSRNTIATWWVPRLSDPKEPDRPRMLGVLGRWKQGLADDGSFDPALKERYRLIRASLDQASP